MKETGEQMDKSAITFVDELVTHVANTRGETADTLFAEAATHPELGDLEDQGPAEFLRSARPSPQGDLFASALLRLASHRHATIDDCAVRPQVVEFLDTQYGDQLQPHYVRTRRTTTYDTLNALAPIASILEDRITLVIDALRSLDNIEGPRRDLFKVLNGSAGRVLFRPFLPPNGIDSSLHDLFSTAIELRETDHPDEIAAAFDKIAARIETLEKAVDQHPTAYGRQILIAATDSLLVACKGRLADKSPPAKLALGTGNRPAPLLEPGVTTTFDLFVVNEGLARAKDIELSFEVVEGDVALPEPQVNLGRMDSRKREEVGVLLMVLARCLEARVRVVARWTNVDKTVDTSERMVHLSAQPPHIDWKRLEHETPYSAYPVEDAEHLVGRDRQLEQLKSHFGSQPLSNLYLTGQRRVGKTSLIRVLTHELSSEENLIVASVEMGEVHTDDATIGMLGHRLAERAIDAAGAEGLVSVPAFDKSLAPLTDVVESIRDLNSLATFLFVIDEFDELPQEYLHRQGPGDALFLPMRSLAQKPNVGWVLVGGERLPFIRDEQADRLNTWDEMSLDHLALGGPSGRGFGELVRAPLPDGFTVDDAAVRRVFDESAGNPHFAKSICAVLFDQMTARRDSLITAEAVREAVETAARVRKVELFAHYWKDGIFESGEQETARRELERRTFLTACAEALRATGSLHDLRVRQAAEARELSVQAIERLRTEFVNRGILRDDEDDAGLAVSVPFFRRWLEAEGIYRLPPKGIAEQTAKEVARKDELLRVTTREVKRLIQHWEGFRYQSKSVTRGQVERWLEQFETPVARRYAFRMLERLRPLDDLQILESFRRLQRTVARDATVELAPGQRSLNHIYVTPLQDSVRDRTFADLYVRANTINRGNVVRADRLIDRLLRRPAITTVVLMQDQVWSARDVEQALEPIAARVGELTARPDVDWFLFGVAGLPAAVDVLADSEAAARLGLTVELAHPLSEEDFPLDNQSTVFSEGDEREAVRRMLVDYGERIGARWPLGYRSTAAPVVFSDECPNSTPAVLWHESKEWRPLFDPVSMS